MEMGYALLREDGALALDEERTEPGRVLPAPRVKRPADVVRVVDGEIPSVLHAAAELLEQAGQDAETRATVVALLLDAAELAEAAGAALREGCWRRANGVPAERPERLLAALYALAATGEEAAPTMTEPARCLLTRAFRNDRFARGDRQLTPEQRLDVAGLTERLLSLARQLAEAGGPELVERLQAIDAAGLLELLRNGQDPA